MWEACLYQKNVAVVFYSKKNPNEMYMTKN